MTTNISAIDIRIELLRSRKVDNTPIIKKQERKKRALLKQKG
jgi:hypothetical protein